MKKFSTILLLFIIMFSTGMGVWIYFKSRGMKKTVEQETTREATYIIKDIRISETIHGDAQWRLIADQAEVFDKEKKTKLRNVKATLYNNDGSIWNLKGDEGVLNNDTKDVYVKGNVVVSSDEGLQLTSDELDYRAQERRLFTEKPVKIVKGGTTITGVGFEADLNKEKVMMKKNVRVVVLNSKNINLFMFGKEKK